MDRKKILVVTDSPKLHTGFARVGKTIFTYLNRTGKYDIKCIGWFHQDTNEEVTYPILKTDNDDKGKPSPEDKYSHKSLPRYIDMYKPDLVWTLGDMWMVDHVASVRGRKSFKWIAYFPIDGHPSPTKWGQTVESMDYAVAYGKYGMEVIKVKAPKANLSYIHHGVDTGVFYPITREERMTTRRELIGVDDSKIVLGVVARNQPRKAFDKLFEAYFYILNGLYIKCSVCEKVTVFPFDLLDKKAYEVKICRHCGSKDYTSAKERDDVRLYIHGALVDCGWDLLDLQNDFNLRGKVLVNPALRVGVGVSDYTLNAVYNSFDIFTLPTRGEGFGLPILEAMSCGVPVVVTNYSAYPEWVAGAGELVPPVALEAEPLTNIRRAIIDMDSYVGSLLKLIDNVGLRKKYGEVGRRTALSMDWKIICAKWEKMIDGILFPSGCIPEAMSPSKVNYILEEV
jgi:glycosyltransferase involved in cell wall biosynthesis